MIAHAIVARHHISAWGIYRSCHICTLIPHRDTRRTGKPFRFRCLGRASSFSACPCQGKSFCLYRVLTIR